MIIKLIKKSFILYFLLSLFTFGNSSEAASLDQYKIGSGAKYNLNLEGSDVEVNISISHSMKSFIGVEFSFSAFQEFSPIRMVQQFHFELQNGKLTPKVGYVKSDLIGKVEERLPPEYLDSLSNSGVRINHFLISKSSDLDKYFIKEESVKVKAGVVSAKAYKITDRGQTVTFWISPDAKPIGIVKLVSEGSKKDQNYTMELSSLLTNVKPMIDPKKAIPLSNTGKLFLKQTTLVHQR